MNDELVRLYQPRYYQALGHREPGLIDELDALYYLRYLNNLRSLASYFKDCKGGGAEDMIRDALVFIDESSHWAHAYIHQDLQDNGVPGRLELERQILDLGRWYEGDIGCKMVLRLLERIMDFEEISLQKRDAETEADIRAQQEQEAYEASLWAMDDDDPGPHIDYDDEVVDRDDLP